MSEPALVADGIRRSFTQGATRLDVLRGASLSLAAGEIVALVGPSGAGKSTLLQIAGLLERPDGGEVVIGGTPCGKLGDGERTRLRRERLGFIYQFHHLLPEFSALENVELPQMIAGVGRAAARDRARELLARLGLEPRAALHEGADHAIKGERGVTHSAAPRPGRAAPRATTGRSWRGRKAPAP